MNCRNRALSTVPKASILNIIVRNLILTLAKKENKRRLLAALFLVFFLAEMGSHIVICAEHSSIDEQSVSLSESNHDDPCKTLVLCGESSRRDKQVPKLGHDAAQHNALFDASSGLLPQIDIHKDPLIPSSTGHRLFRPPSPPFHPPQTS